MRPDLVRGNLDLLLLVIIGDGAGHGYAIIEELKTRSGGVLDLPEGTVYPALHRLERAGFLSSTWDESTGRRRRTYTVTAQGRKAATQKRHEFSAFAALVQRVLDGGSPGTATGGASWPTPA
jgi:DNA-binding PadR family transcriptional regulator